MTQTLLAPPKNQMAHLLHEMLQGKMITERSYRYNSFRSSISDLINDFGVPIRHKDVPFVNRYGRKSKHRKHYILSIHRAKAIKVFNRINK